MTDTATLQARLAEAEAALHKLTIGRGTEAVTHADGRSLRYTAADLAELRAYIQDLKRQLDPATPARWPIGVRF